MQIKFLLPVFLYVLIQFSCHQKNKVSDQKTDTTEKKSFFPVTEFIKGQLRQVDSLQITPLKITTNNGTQDSQWIKITDVRTFAEPFLHPKIDTNNLKDLFTESSFMDQTINAITFSYDPSAKLPDSIQLRHWDVYIDPQTSVITRVYLVKQKAEGQKNITVQLTWMAGHWCKITTITEQPGKQSEIKDEKVIWDFNEQ